MENLDLALRRYFGFEEFRPGQREVIEKILAHRHTLAVLPTGRGKSLCYQLTAQMLPGVTVVISPLIALMQDQVESLNRRGLYNVTYLSSTLSASEISARYEEIERGEYKLVYVAPERCDSPRFQQLARGAAIDLLVIDEAHCISQWGHDFRPHYRTLLTRLPELRRATFLALTATATPDVQEDIVRTLALPHIERVTADFNRPNLFLETLRADRREEKDARLMELLAPDDGSAIVYASTRKEAASVYQSLSARGFDVCLYHAGLGAEERTAAQRDFQSGNRRVIVATVAFGMGVDKPDVRRVIHYNIPGSLEAYYQEAGRAGRDGGAATCTLLYSQPDVRIQRFLIDSAYPEPKAVFRVWDALRRAHPQALAPGEVTESGELPELTVNAALQLLYEQQWVRITPDGRYALARTDAAHPRVDFRPLTERRNRVGERLKRMIEYAAGSQCRRQRILSYFGQHFTPPCDGCDICCKAESVSPSPAAADPVEANEASDQTARIILRTAGNFGGRIGRALIAEVLSGSKRKRIIELNLDQAENYGALGRHSRDQVLAWIDELAARGWLAVTAEEYPRLYITDEGRLALETGDLLPLSSLARRKADESRAARANAIGDQDEPDLRPPADAASVELLAERLRQWRRAKAGQMNVSAFIVLHNRMLEEIAARQPLTIEELGAVRGIGASRAESFGAEILQLVREVAGQSAEAAIESVAAAGLEDAATEPDDEGISVSLPELRLRIEMWRQGGAAPDERGLLAALRNLSETDPSDAAAIVGALAKLGIREAAGPLAQLLKLTLKATTNGSLLAVICEALGELGAAQAAPDLIALLADERPAVRRAAVRALGTMRVWSARARLELLADEDASDHVRLAARAAVRLLQD